MAITRTSRRISSSRQVPITAGTRSTSGVGRHQSQAAIKASRSLSPAKRSFVNQMTATIRRNNQRITAATNTSNIMARPDFLELLPIFVQKLIVLDVFGSVPMNSRQQLIPYFKFIAENTKGETKRGTVLSSPFVNRQGVDPNFTGRVVKNEEIGDKATGYDAMFAQYTPILPGSVTVYAMENGVSTPYTDNGAGGLVDGTGQDAGSINYSNGSVVLKKSPTAEDGMVKVTYQYDNETVGPDEAGNYGAKMAKGYLQLDEINLVAEAREIACYWSVYSAFAATQEYGGNLSEMAKEAAFGELAAEINSAAFEKLWKAATLNPMYNWNAAPVMNGSVVPSDYLNMLKLKLNQAAASVYQRTHLSRPNRIVAGTNASEYIGMINGFVSDNTGDNVGPYHAGRLDNFEVYVDPNMNPDTWVMACKSDDIRRSSGLFGQYMPFIDTGAVGLADMSVQSGYATMNATEIVNPASVVGGRIIGTF